MQMGPRNPENKYTMKGVELAVTKQEMDIGVAITANLKLSAQCAKAAGTAQTVQVQICRASASDTGIFLLSCTNSMSVRILSFPRGHGHRGQQRT